MTLTRANAGFNDIALTVLNDRYLWRDESGEVIETPLGMLDRVAHCISKGNKAKWDMYTQMMLNKSFLPNSPTLMNAGRKNMHGQLSACYVLDVPDNMAGIFESLKNQALIHKFGGGTGFNFSKLRPKGSRVASTNGVASGPLSFMELFDQATEKVMQGGMRRGANMAILNVDHPDIREFITAKATDSSFHLSNFNLSVGITNEFMNRVLDENDKETEHLFNLICYSAWESGDPGLVFLDTINEYNTTPWLGPLEATNPCGETPLYPFEACNLGSINLSKFVTLDEEHSNWTVDWYRLRETVTGAVYFLNDVIDVNHYPLPEIEAAVERTRKIGLGVMGWADMLFKMGIVYGSEESLALADKVMKFINDEAHLVSKGLSESAGYVYPNDYSSRPIGQYNSTLTCIAPTGTISLLAGCSSGIEPVFALQQQRRMLTHNGTTETLNIIHPEYEKALNDKYGDLRLDKGVFVTAHDISPEAHIRMQAAFQKHVDLAVSKTINMPHSATVDDVRRAFILAWREKCKGTTIYRDGCKATGQVLYHKCPNCKEGVLIPSGGCMTCPDCGYSPCGVA